MTRASRDIVRLGRIVGLFGVRGWVKVFSYTEPREGIVGSKGWLLGYPDGWQERKVVEGRRSGRSVIAQLEGVGDRESAERLLGLEIGVPREALPDPGATRYYWADLEGLLVRRRDGTPLGRVERLLETGAHDVMVVGNEPERLIPFVIDAVVLDVDLDAGVISVDWDWD